jgi:hypothetical protein
MFDRRSQRVSRCRALRQQYGFELSEPERWQGENPTPQSLGRGRAFRFA